jgi:F0F1-type ATP synthase assembly protein I
MLQRAVFRLAIWQVVLTVLVAGIAAWIGGTASAVSAATGGGIGIVAGLYQGLRMFSVDASRNPEGFMKSVYVTEALKVVTTVALTIAAIKLLQVKLLPFFAGYIAIYAVYWAALRTRFPWNSKYDVQGFEK